MNMPFRLNLEQQKKRSKELLKAFQQHNNDAIERFENHHPKRVYNDLSQNEFVPKLADAQLVIARELGCKTWSQLRHHIGIMESLRGEVNNTDTVPDEPQSCLHIRCGEDIKTTLIEAGFKGDFLEFSDPFCTGPVSYDYDIQQRADFLNKSYGSFIGRHYADIVTGLTSAYQALQSSTKQYEHIVLWFEHDTYDQLILIFLLSQFHRFGLPKQLWMVTANQFPGSDRFIGLGQLPPEGLRLLWQTKQAVTTQQCAEGDQHWAAFTDSNPNVFYQHVNRLSDSQLPYFKTAALRQIQEQPTQQDQLPLTQQLTVDLLRNSTPQKAAELYQQLMKNKEPLPFLGDIMYWHILLEMRDNNLIEIVQEAPHWADSLIALTPNSIK